MKSDGGGGSLRRLQTKFVKSEWFPSPGVGWHRPTCNWCAQRAPKVRTALANSVRLFPIVAVTSKTCSPI